MRTADDVETVVKPRSYKLVYRSVVKRMTKTYYYRTESGQYKNRGKRGNAIQKGQKAGEKAGDLKQNEIADDTNY